MRDARKQAPIPSIVFILMVVCQLTLFTCFGEQKTAYHVDELFTYGLSNSYDKAFLYDGAPSDGLNNTQFNHWMDQSVFFRYITVQPGEGFAYDKVYYNQTQDVHPPLYYMLIHTICSFFPNTFSKWFGLCLNFGLFVFCQIVLFQLSNALLKSREKALLVCALWGFGAGALNTVLFIRMYTLLTLLTLLSVLIHVKILQLNKLPAKYLVGFIITTILGGLTQYYFYIFASLLAVFVGAFFVSNGSKRNLFVYTAATASSFLTAFAVFPAVFLHLNGYRGADAVYGIKNLEISGSKLHSIYSMINQELFGLPDRVADLLASFQASIWFLLCVGVAITILLIYLVYALRKSKKLSDKIEELKSKHPAELDIMASCKRIFKNRERAFLITMLGIMLLFTWIISNIAPEMGVFMDRYVFCVFPLICILAVACLWAIFSKLVKRTWLRNAALILLIAVFTFGSHWNSKGQYLYQENEPRTQLSTTIAGTNCIFVMEHDYLLHSMSNLFMRCENVFPTRSDDVDQIIQGIDSAPGNCKITLIISVQAYNDLILHQIEDKTDYHPLFVSKGLSGDQYYYIYELQNS